MNQTIERSSFLADAFSSRLANSYGCHKEDCRAVLHASEEALNDGIAITRLPIANRTLQRMERQVRGASLASWTARPRDAMLESITTARYNQP